MDRIKNMYATFFDQSQELQYQMRDVQVEQYPNPLEIKARYELNQVAERWGKESLEGPGSLGFG